jgi:hypothetical protein
MQEVKNPYPIFLGLDGLALELGYIYIGLENQDPETNPKSCFWDADGTQSATQPIRTLAGYPDRLGSPAQIFTSGKYSIRVRDSLGNQVFYLASAGETETISSGDPYHVHSQFLGDPPGVQQVVCKHVFGVAVSFESDLPDAAYLQCDTLPGSDCVFNMAHNGVVYGTWTVDTTGDSTIVCDEQDFAIGDWFDLISPATSTSIANFALTMIGAAA